MGNLIANLLAKAGPMGQMVQQAAGMAQAMQSGNPMGALMGQSDPRMQQVIDYVNQNGGNPEQVFYALAKAKGADPNDILTQVKSFIGQ